MAIINSEPFVYFIICDSKNLGLKIKHYVTKNAECPPSAGGSDIRCKVKAN